MIHWAFLILVFFLGFVAGYWYQANKLAQAIKAAGVYECGVCHQHFSIPREDFDKVRCPDCGREWTKEELCKLKRLPGQRWKLRKDSR